MKNTTFNFGIGNIFDKSYVRHSAFLAQSSTTDKSYEVGRNFKFQISYRF
jgi:outer membrane receptor protein involved in Fe transport